MTWFADLSPYRFLEADGAANVGWLSAGHEVPTGDVPAGVIERIQRLVRDHPVNRTRGWHRCDLCAEPEYPVVITVDGVALDLGDAEIRVAGRDGVVYAAPTLIAHYIGAHGYLPPAGFVEAVLIGEAVLTGTAGGPSAQPSAPRPPRGLRRWLSPRSGSRPRPR